MQDNLQKEVDHLASVLKQNSHNASAPPTQETADSSSRDEEQKRKTIGGDTLCGWDE